MALWYNIICPQKKPVLSVKAATVRGFRVGPSLGYPQSGAAEASVAALLGL